MAALLRRTAVVAALILAFTASPASAATGGVNTGLVGSTCAADATGFPFSESTDPGVTSDGLGAMPAYYELGAPTGPHAGQPPKGVMLVIHGGGWWRVGKGL